MLERPGLAALMLAATAALSATTYTVTSTADSGAGSLRKAIDDANTNPGADTIAFNIVGSGVHTIAPASALPPITGPVVIDGYTQPGALANINPTSQGLNTVLKIELDGTNAGAVACLDVQADDVTIKGLVINRWTGIGIQTTGAHADLVVEGCFIGSNPAGSQALAPYGGGVLLRTHTNARIGGTTPAARNLVSGNGNSIPQIQIGDFTGDTTGTVVAGNLVGTDATGRTLLANLAEFVWIRQGFNNTIGGTSAAARNVLAGGDLVLGGGIDGLEAPNNLVQGNFFGIDVTGEVVLSCYGQCISMNSRNNTVGGSTPGAGNRIGGALGDGGIKVFGSGAVIQGNFIGTDASGDLRLPNSYWGILVSANDVTIGGTNPGEGNVIAHNLGWGGVGVAGGQNVSIRGNSIFDNAGDPSNPGLAIDLYISGATGVNLNDPADADIGANGLQNYPIVASVIYGGASTTVAGTLDSKPSTIYDVDVYADEACSRPQDLPEGRIYVGSLTVTTDGAGHGTFNEALPVAVAANTPITATATDPGGNTSEYSPRFLFNTLPRSGSPAGSNITAYGFAFQAGATATVGGLPATNINVPDAHTVTMRTPALPAGSVNDVVVSNPGGGLSGTLPAGYVADFNDIGGSLFYTQIIQLVANRVATGIGGGNYGPNNSTLRQQMAVFILKGKYGVCYQPPPCTGVFADVPCSNPFAKWIEAFAAEGITGGCGGPNYCPGNPVTRQQMAVFLLKGKHGSGYVPPLCDGDFADVVCGGPSGNPFANWIEQLAAENITSGCGGPNYCPFQNVTRGQMATFLVKAFRLP